ncbi:MAG: hypothetical protein RRA51_08325, partial [Armatimonadota bacterium]|nr:hypothetical protein [Armatimonadota bacterium]
GDAVKRTFPHQPPRHRIADMSDFGDVIIRPATERRKSKGQGGNGNGARTKGQPPHRSRFWHLAFH